MKAQEREKLLSLDQRTRRIYGSTTMIGSGEVALDCRKTLGFTRYLWRGPVTGKLYRLDIESTPSR